jgi:hypothetical protein
MDLCAQISFLWFLLTAEFRAVLWKKKFLRDKTAQKFKQKRIRALGAEALFRCGIIKALERDLERNEREARICSLLSGKRRRGGEYYHALLLFVYLINT